jgi:hypothetical protein
MSQFVNGAIKQFEYYKQIAQKALEPLSNEHIHFTYNEESNSIAIIIQHITGNMLSRFTNFLITDGEKDWRNRDAEFEKNILVSKDKLIEHWLKGWDCLFAALQKLTDDDLQQIVYIRNIGQTVQDAITRQLCHYSYHIGQIVYIAKMIQNNKWESLSIAKNQSDNYNKEKFNQEKSIKHFNDKS